MNQWQEWVHEVTGGASSRQVGERIGRSHTTALKWMHEPVSPEAVIVLAHAYDADVPAGFVAAGWLEEADLKLTLDEVLRRVSPVKLTAELHRRALEAYERQRRASSGSVFDETRPDNL